MYLVLLNPFYNRGAHSMLARNIREPSRIPAPFAALHGTTFKRDDDRTRLRADSAAVSNSRSNFTST